MSELTKEDEYGIISRTMMNIRSLRVFAREVDFEQLLEMQEKLNVVVEERREDAEREAAERQELEAKRQQAIEYIISLGLDPESLLAPVTADTVKTRRKAKGGVRKAKYRFKDENGEIREWSGNGKRPLALQKLLDEGMITVNNNKVKSNYKVAADDIINVHIPELVVPEIVPEDIPLDIVYEDDDIIVINKPKGMVVHPAAGHYSGTLVNALMYHCRDNLSGINGVLRPGIVHRIDMNTTGVIVACKNDYAHNFIAQQLSVHSITRKYYAIVHNQFNNTEGVVDAPIGRNPSDRKKMAVDKKNGKRAVTHYRVLEQFGKFSYIECQLETGRTHQIRVHMASIGHPLLGDDVYGSGKSPFNLCGQTLHAGVLGFIHPTTKEYVEYSADLPEYFQKVISRLRNS